MGAARGRWNCLYFDESRDCESMNFYSITPDSLLILATKKHKKLKNSRTHSELFVFLVAKISNEQSVIEFEQTMKGGDPMRLTEMVACSG